MTASRFHSRLEAIDEGSQEFLLRLIELGGYCTADQAKRLTLSDESTGTRTRLRALERARFLRRITRYPVIYQVTKSAVRLIARDSSARRSHVTATIQARLLGVSFYLEAKEWPAEFVFDHEEKITAFHNAGCPATALPQRAGEPYLWEEFVLPLDNGISVAMIDHTHRSCFWQALGFVRRFVPALKVLGHKLGLTIVIGSETRYRTYSRLVHHRTLKKAAGMDLGIFLSPYLVQGANLSIPQLIWPAQTHPEEFDDAESAQINNNFVRGRLSAPAEVP